MVYASCFFVALLLSLMPLVKICSIWYLHCLSDYTYIDFCIISVPVNGRCFFKKKLYSPFGWGSTASRLQSHYEETVCFLPVSSQEFLVLISSTSEGWKAESTLEPPSGLNDNLVFLTFLNLFSQLANKLVTGFTRSEDLVIRSCCKFRI